VRVVEGVDDGVSLALDAVDLLLCPRVERDRLDARDVRAHAPVHAGTAQADEVANVPRRPARALLGAVGAHPVLGLLEQVHQDGLVAGLGLLLVLCHSNSAGRMINWR